MKNIKVGGTSQVAILFGSVSIWVVHPIFEIMGLWQLSKEMDANQSEEPNSVLEESQQTINRLRWEVRLLRDFLEVQKLKHAITYSKAQRFLEGSKRGQQSQPPLLA